LLDIDGTLIEAERARWTEYLMGHLQGFRHDVLLVGHTHQVFCEQLGNTLVINPGSTLFNHTCAILSLPEMSVEWFGLSGKQPVKAWNWAEERGKRKEERGKRKGKEERERGKGKRKGYKLNRIAEQTTVQLSHRPGLCRSQSVPTLRFRLARMRDSRRGQCSAWNFLFVMRFLGAASMTSIPHRANT
jgi:hypothetical protein